MSARGTNKQVLQNIIVIVHFILMTAAAIAILVSSVRPLMSLDSGTPINTGIGMHVIAYGTLCFLICMWLLVSGTTHAPVLYAFIFTCLYGLLIECVQFGIPYRSFEVGDIMINCLAAAVAMIPCNAMILCVPLYRRQLQGGKLVLD